MSTRRYLSSLLAVAFAALGLLAPGISQAAFGIKPGSLSAVAVNAEGNPDFQAGSHPYKYVASFELNADAEGFPESELRGLIFKLPPGLIGNPLAAPSCSTTLFNETVSKCPGDTQIGVLRIVFGASEIEAFYPIALGAPPIGSPARFGFSILGFNSYQDASLRSDGDFGIDISDSTIPSIEIRKITEEIWGVPGDPRHDTERECFSGFGAHEPCASTTPYRPFLTLPTSCNGPLKTTLEVDSIDEPEVFDTATYESQLEGIPTGLDGCNQLTFDPTISSRATTNLADNPSGLDVSIHQTQPGDSPDTIAQKSCSEGEWSGNPTSFAYQWLRNGSPIPGATSSTYTVQDADAESLLQCEVTASAPGAPGPGRSISNRLEVRPQLKSNTQPAAPQGAFAYFVEVNETAKCEAYFSGPFANTSYRWFKDGVLVPGATEEELPVDFSEAPFTLQCEALREIASETESESVGTVNQFSENLTTESPPPSPPLLPSPIAPPQANHIPLQLPPGNAHLKDVRLTLPAGMSVNPSAGAGLAACSDEQIGRLDGVHFSKLPQSCPDAAKIGKVEVKTPLVDHPLQGGIYVAEPFKNPFGSLLAIYLAIEDERTGTVAKLAGKVEADPGNGQLSAVFSENPQLPIEDIKTHFFNGVRATLKTPLTCGKKTTTSVLRPWSSPEGQDVSLSDSFETSVAAGGPGTCPTTEAAAPNNPAFSAGTLAPQAGAYSSFILRLVRKDGSQQLSGLETTLPGGLTGKLAGIPYCPEAAIAAARSRETPNQGGVEQTAPSCPAASEVGSVTVGAGAGITPLVVGGHVYLAGPYKGAPLSFVIVTPAIAGPFDLGAVVVRAALYVNPETAQIHAVSDPFPTILDGIPLDVRSIELELDRPGFTLNPTSCEPKQVTATVIALTGQAAPLQSNFQVGGCKSLGFKPKLALRVFGKTNRTAKPRLRAVLTAKPGEANIASAQVSLPHSLFLEQAHIKTVCTRVQFAAGAGDGEGCPSGSIYGHATASTPLLDKPLEGPVYLRSSSHKLPDLVAALNGQIDVALAGKVDSGRNGGLRTTFEVVPDAPVSRFVLEMRGGKKGLLVNSENLCSKTAKTHAIVRLTAQNGKVEALKPIVGSQCQRSSKHHAKH